MSARTLKAWLWKLLTLPVVTLLYCIIVAEGLRFLLPVMAQRLSRVPLPGFSSLRDYEWSHRLDLAHFFAVLILVAVWFMWKENLKALLFAEAAFVRSGLDPEMYRLVVQSLGAVLLGADAILFYIAAARLTWGGSMVSFTALVGTALYLGVIVFVSFVSVILENPNKELED